MEYRFRHFKEIDSTNDYLISLAEKGESEGLVVTTDFQDAGRGQFERKWQSAPEDNLLLSVLLKPEMSVQKSSFITQLAAVSVKEALDDFLPESKRCELKKPNDVLINKKKISGILTESGTHGMHTDYVVVGFGINVNAPKKRLPEGATSLFLELRSEIDRQDVLSILLDVFKREYLLMTGRNN